MLNDKAVLPRVKVSNGGRALADPISSLKSGIPLPLESFESSMERNQIR